MPARSRLRLYSHSPKKNSSRYTISRGEQYGGKAPCLHAHIAIQQIYRPPAWPPPLSHLKLQSQRRPLIPAYSQRMTAGRAFCVLLLVSIYIFSFAIWPAALDNLLVGNVNEREEYFLEEVPSRSGVGPCPVSTGKPPRGCEAQRFAMFTNESSDSDLYQMLTRAFECLIEHVVTPVIAGRSHRKMRNSDIAGCNSGELADFGTTLAEGWRALAERRLCVLEEQLYSAVTSCHLSAQRGMYINSSR